jgi:AmmeMemoRadiSam system protein B
MSTAPTRVRAAAVAGTFYPGDAGALSTMVDGLLADATAARPSSGRLRALVVPHAGYVYSGPIAASAYTRLREHPGAFTRAVVIGPAHRVPLRGVAVTAADAFATPLGLVAVDTAARARLLALPGVVVDDEAHAFEHSVEVQLPFLQRVAPGLPMVPLVVGHASREVVAGVLDDVWDDETLLVVSTDLSHYLEYATASTIDAQTAANIVAANADGIGDRDACGAYGLRALLEVGRARGLRVAQLDLRSSGDTAGPRDQVVGYGAFAVETA